MFDNNPMLQKHLISNILKLQGRILEFKGRIHKIVHKSC
jgi:hypothetical protein